MVDSVTRWLRKHPLLLLALAAVAGILAEDVLRLPVSWSFGAVCLLAWLPWLLRRTRWWALPGVACLFALSHAHRLEQTFDHPLRQALFSSLDHAKEATLRGNLHLWLDGAEIDPSTALCEIREIRLGNTSEFTPSSAWVRIKLPPGMTWDKPGEYELSGRLQLPAPALNPGQFDPVSYSLRNGWVAEMSVRRLRLIKEDSWAVMHHFQLMAETSRQWMSQALMQGIQPDDKNAGVILAMALGASDAAGDEIEDAFRDSGTLHVFAVSGLHVVLLGEMVGYALFAIGRRKRGIVVILVVFVYAFITGWRPSAIRAAIMMALVHAAPFVNRKSLVSNSLGAAALVLLAYDTHQLFMPGFQLSFAVLLAILLPGLWLMERARPWAGLDPFLPPSLASWQQRGASKVRTFTASSLTTSAGALIGSLPLLGFHFHTLTSIALFSNLLLVPMSSFCLGLACASLLATALHWTSLVVFFNTINAWLAYGMVTIVTWFAAIPGGNVAITLPASQRPALEMQVLHLPYGGGACYIRSGDRKWLLDTGNETAWRRVVRPFLNYQGINRLDGLILSHADMGHAGAAQKTLQRYRIPSFHTSSLEPWPLDPPFASLRRLVKEHAPDSTAWRRHGFDDILSLSAPRSPAAIARPLYPTQADRFEKADDRGLVLMIEADGFKILYLNDAGFITEKTLLARHADLKCDILIRHQHSTDFAGLTEFLLAAQPRVIVSSNDPYLPEERLPERIRSYCASRGIPLFDLARDGSVHIQLGPGEVRLKGHVSGQAVTLEPRILP